MAETTNECRNFVLPPETLDALTDLGLGKPSEDSMKCIKIALKRKDVWFHGKKGIGKIVGLTLALLSLSENQTRVSIVCTPSELENYESLSKKKPTLEFGIFSDASHTDENEETRKTPHVVVGAPSTIEKLINEKKINVENLQHIIFDECDQHFHDADELKKAMRILKYIREKKQIVCCLFSNEVDGFSEVIKEILLQQPIEEIRSIELNLNQLDHYWIASPKRKMFEKLEKWLKRLPSVNAKIFVESKDDLDILEKFAKRSVDDRRQIERSDDNDENMSNIVIRRGGDNVKMVDVVFNFDEPKNPETYPRRVAHAGSLRTKGLVITFVSDEKNGEKPLVQIGKKLNIGISNIKDIKKTEWLDCFTDCCIALVD